MFFDSLKKSALTSAFSGMTGAISRVLSLSGHLSGTRVAARLKPPVGTAGQAIVPVGVAADRVYRPPVLPRGAVSSYLAFPPLPLAARTLSAAVYLCCTIPGVAPGGRYPLSLPCAARTFLMPKARDRLHQSQKPVYRKNPPPSNQTCKISENPVYCYARKRRCTHL